MSLEARIAELEAEIKRLHQELRLAKVSRYGDDYVVLASGCWQWQKSLQAAGYGRVKRDRGHEVAHRWYYRHLVGPIPAGLVLDHLCCNILCVNPDHLEPVTPGENIRRGWQASASRRRL